MMRQRANSLPGLPSALGDFKKVASSHALLSHAYFLDLAASADAGACNLHGRSPERKSTSSGHCLRRLTSPLGDQEFEQERRPREYKRSKCALAVVTSYETTAKGTPYTRIV